jgi:rare lipoprotein A
MDLSLCPLLIALMLPQPEAVTSVSAKPARAGTAAPAVVRGVAAWYGEKFHGHATASGESFDMHALTAAHRTLPFGTRVRVRHPCNGRSVVVRINDRGPFTPKRIIDLSRAAARELGLARKGQCKIELEVLGRAL